MAKVQTIVASAANMSQSSVIGASLIGGFVIYLMLIGRLGNYWSILMGGAASAPTTGQGGVTSSSGISSQAPGSIGTAGKPAVSGQPGSPAFVPNPNASIFNPFSWYIPSSSTTQGTLTPFGSHQAGGGIGMM